MRRCESRDKRPLGLRTIPGVAQASVHVNLDKRRAALCVALEEAAQPWWLFLDVTVRSGKQIGACCGASSDCTRKGISLERSLRVIRD